MSPYAPPGTHPLAPALPPSPAIRPASGELAQQAMGWLASAESSLNYRPGAVASFMDGLLNNGVDPGHPGRVAYAGACASIANVYATLANLAYQQERDERTANPYPH